MILTFMILCWILAAICNAVMDVLAFKFKTSVFRKLNPDWWNPSISWRNKYKEKKVFKGPAFPGSTTVFSFVTDAWHLFQFLMNTFIIFSICLAFLVDYNFIWWHILLSILVLKVLWGGVFELFYSKIFRVKL